MTQTDRTRLRSLLLLGTEKLEEWLPNATTDDEAVTSGELIQGLDLDLDGNDHVDQANDKYAERALFNDMFYRTLSEMGALS
jgi:hypothetical protein